MNEHHVSKNDMLYEVLTRKDDEHIPAVPRSPALGRRTRRSRRHMDQSNAAYWKAGLATGRTGHEGSSGPLERVPRSQASSDVLLAGTFLLAGQPNLLCANRRII